MWTSLAALLAFVGVGAAWVTAHNEAGVVVRLEIRIESQAGTISEPYEREVYVGPGQEVSLTVRVREAEGSRRPIDVRDPDDLVELQQVNSSVPFVTVTEMSRIGPGVYRATYRFDNPGEYTIEIHPEIEGRRLLHPETTDRVKLTVGEAPISNEEPRLGALDLVVSLILVAVVTALVLVATRSRSQKGRRDPGPTPPDSWWNPP